MPQSRGLKTVTNFVGGLNTETGFLNFPENTATAISNVVLKRDGSLRRRLGFNFEDNYSLSDYSIDDSDLTDIAIAEYNWEGADNSSNNNFVVIQTGPTLHFYDSNIKPLSGAKKSFTVDLDTYKVAGLTTAGKEVVDMDTGRGALFVVSPSIEPIYIEYSTDTDTITVSKINIRIRDTEGLDDGLEVDENPTTLSDEHKYNLKNQGWLPPSSGQPDPLTQYKSKNGSYPSNSQQWWIARVGNDYKLDDIAEVFFGKTPAPKGHYIVDAFEIDRATASGITGLSIETESTRPSTVTFYAGRVFFGFKSKVYYSQVLTSLKKAGDCFQEADPTSEEISDPISTDGGVINIPEMGDCFASESINKSLLMFSKNGVWQISGPEGEAFKSTDFFVHSVSNTTPQGKQSIIKTEDNIYWWSTSGIFSLNRDSISGNLFDETITDAKIKTEITNVDQNDKKDIKGVYDTLTKRIFWMYKTPSNLSSLRYRYDRVLVYDTLLEAFYPWDISFKENNSPYIVGIHLTSVTNSGTITTDVTTDDGTLVENSSGEKIITSEDLSQTENTYVKYLTIVPDVGGTDNNITFVEENSSTFKDWEEADYTSFVETGYNLGGDISRWKRAPYVNVFCGRTETRWVLNELGDGLVPNFPSSLKMRAFWQWSDNDNSNVRSREQEMYKRKRVYTPDELKAQDFKDGFPVVSNRVKVRGRGAALQFRFSSSEGKDFHLLGWSVLAEVNQNV